MPKEDSAEKHKDLQGSFTLAFIFRLLFIKIQFRIHLETKRQVITGVMYLILGFDSFCQATWFSRGGGSFYCNPLSLSKHVGHLDKDFLQLTSNISRGILLHKQIRVLSQSKSSFRNRTYVEFYWDLKKSKLPAHHFLTFNEIGCLNYKTAM